jgi:mannose-6-phosphate isomerase-like protein (cupin superfamily)
MRGVEKIETRGRLLALIVRRNYDEGGIRFFTPNELSQQLAYMRHPAGKVIDPHIHTPATREVLLTQETLFIKRGKLRVDFFDDEQSYLESRILEAGDVILLVQGGHGFEVLEELEMFEVKQGPYKGNDDKTRFNAILPSQLRLGPDAARV